jgi:hypothetical protein
MHSLSSLAFAGALAVGGLYLAFAEPHPDGETAVDTLRTAAVSDTQRYQLKALGIASSCILTVRNGIAGEQRPVTVSGDCDTRHPAFMASARWTEDTHGTVTLADAHGRAIAHFAPGDGIAFESTGQGRDFLTLAALR